MKETAKEKEDRIDAMLRTMIVESSLFALEHEEAPPEFTLRQIADFVGCGQDTIKRIQDTALRKLEKKLLQ